ncbi:MAG: FAD-dependent oxidoreductase [Bacteroidota bacterium]
MRFAIVGAGPAGLAAAHSLRDADVAVTVFEKSRGLSGRAATRWRDAEDLRGQPFRWRYDHGAQYLSPEADSDVARLVRAVVPEADLVEIDGAVWPFDDDGTLRPDRARPEAGLRWTLRDGIADLGRRLADATPGLDLRLQTRVASLARDGATWTVEVADGDPEAGFDAVLVTAPAPQAADLLRASRLGEADGAALVAALTEADYRAQFSVVWAFDREVDRPEGVYALVNADEHGASGGGHAVAWLAVESDKPNRAPAGASLLIAQMAPAWTEAHYDADRADVVAAATEAVAGLLGALPDPLWTDTQRWRYALPNAQADAEALQAASGHGLFFAGDFTAAKGRVHLALEQGTEAARRMLLGRGQ